MENWLQASALVLSALIAVGGWLFNAKQERDFRRFELRTNYRIKMLEDALAVIWALGNENLTPKVNEQINEVRVQASIFGTVSERRIIERLVKMTEGHGSILDIDIDVLVNGLRSEIGLAAREQIGEGN